VDGIETSRGDVKGRRKMGLKGAGEDESRERRGEA
jgi:hypothetical protein